MIPTPRVEIGFGSTWRTEPADITWTDVTTYVSDRRSPVKATRGASAAFGEPDTGSLTLTLRNADRRFDPTHTAGPYYGELLPGTPVRIYADVLDVVTDGGSVVTDDGEPVWDSLLSLPVWTGTVAKWPQRYDRGNTMATVPLAAWDQFDKLSRAKIPQAVYPLEVLRDSPVAYWRLGESAGNQMLDDSGNANHGVYDNAELGQPPLIVDEDGGAIEVLHVGDNRGQYKGEGLPEEFPVTLEAWVRTERDLAMTKTILVTQRDNAYGSGLWLGIETTAGGSPNGELVVNFFGLREVVGGAWTGNGFYKARGSTRIDDGEVHHVVMTAASTDMADVKLYVDGVEETKTLIFGTAAGQWDGHFIWCVGNVAASSAFDFGLEGTVDEVAVYDQALSAARVLTHYEAGALAFSGDTTDERMTYLLDQLDWPATARELEAGRTILGPALFRGGDSALGYLRLLTDSEDGSLFIAADGSLTFHDRYWRYLDAKATVSQITFSDQPGNPHYADFELDTDDDLIVNVARYSRRGGAQQVAVDQASIDVHGEAEKQHSDLLVATDAAARSLAEWTVATRSMPQPRVPSIRVPLHGYSFEDQSAVLALDLGHRVTASRHPQGVGDPITLDFVVDGIDHTISVAEWWVDLYVSPAPDSTVDLFLIGTSEIGSTDILAH